MFNQIFDPQFVTFICKLLLAMVLGLVLGLERVYTHKTVGMRSYALVSVASASLVAISIFIGENFFQFSFGFNPVFIVGCVIIGIGLLGSGVVRHKNGQIENLTTASGILASSAIGMMVGFDMFREALFTSIVIFFVLGILSIVERLIQRASYSGDTILISEEESPAPKKRVYRRKVKSEEEA